MFVAVAAALVGATQVGPRFEMASINPTAPDAGFNQQMAMLRQLLEDRFKLKYRREKREMVDRTG